MNFLLYCLFLSVFLLDYFALDLQLISRKTTWAPEILSCIMVLIVSLRARHFALRPKYLLLFCFAILHIVIGIIINSVGAGQVFTGLRGWLKYLPFFFIPIVYQFSDKQINRQLRLLLILSIVQFPVVMYQRFYQFKGTGTGDVITGTLGSTNILTVFLMGSLSMIYAFYLHKKMSRPMFLGLVLVSILPSGLNLSKAAIILIPFAFFIPILFYGEKSIRKRRLLFTTLTCVVVIAIFTITHDMYMKRRYGYSTLDFFLSKSRLKQYLMQDIAPSKKKPEDIESKTFITKEKLESRPQLIGKIDSVLLALRVLSNDPVNVVVGFGIGNTTESHFKKFSGKYSEYASLHGASQTAMSFLLWEMGVGGVLIYLLFYVFLVVDCIRLVRKASLSSVIGLGWIGFLTILLISSCYTNYFLYNVIGYIVAYFSGYIVSQNMYIQKVIRSNT